MDIVDAAVRSRMMSSIRGKDTKPEMLVRRYLHARGLRFRVHRRDLPGRPDVVLPKWKAAIFVHGCFWHGHNQCPYFRLPATRTEFWQFKIAGNVARDARAEETLRSMGWRVLVVWECAIRDHSAGTLEALHNQIEGDSIHVDIASRGDHLEVRAE